MSQLTNLNLSALREIAKSEQVDLKGKRSKKQISDAIKYRRKTPCMPGKVIVKGRCSPGNAELAAMKVLDLKTKAKEFRIPGYSTMTKPQLVKSIYKKQGEIGGMPPIMVPVVPSFADDLGAVGDNVEMARMQAWIEPVQRQEEAIARRKGSSSKSSRSSAVPVKMTPLEVAREVAIQLQRQREEEAAQKAETRLANLSDDKKRERILDDALYEIEQSDEEQSDEEQSDEEQSDEEQSDEEEQSDVELSDEEREQIIDDVLSEIYKRGEGSDSDSDVSIRSSDISDGESDVEVIKEVSLEEALNKKFKEAEVIAVGDSDDDDDDEQSDDEQSDDDDEQSDDDDEETQALILRRQKKELEEFVFEEVERRLKREYEEKAAESFRTIVGSAIRWSNRPYEGGGKMRNFESIYKAVNDPKTWTHLSDSTRLAIYVDEVTKEIEEWQDASFAASFDREGYKSIENPSTELMFFSVCIDADATLRAGEPLQVGRLLRIALAKTYKNLYEKAFRTRDINALMRNGKYLNKLGLKSKVESVYLPDHQYQKDVNELLFLDDGSTRIPIYQVISLMGYTTPDKITQSIAFQLHSLNNKFKARFARNTVLQKVYEEVVMVYASGDDKIRLDDVEKNYCQQIIDHCARVERFEAYKYPYPQSVVDLIADKLKDDKFLQTRQRRTMELYVLSYQTGNVLLAESYLGAVADTFDDREKLYAGGEIPSDLLDKKRAFGEKAGVKWGVGDEDPNIVRIGGGEQSKSLADSYTSEEIFRAFAPKSY